MNMPTPEAIVGLPTIMPLLEAPTTTPSEVAKPEKRKIQHTEVKPAKRKRTMMPNLEQDLSLQTHIYREHSPISCQIPKENLLKWTETSHFLRIFDMARQANPSVYWRS